MGVVIIVWCGVAILGFECRGESVVSYRQFGRSFSPQLVVSPRRLG